MKGYITEEDVDKDYLKDLIEELLPIVKQIGKQPDENEELIKYALKSTIYKVLIYINRVDLPEPLKNTVIEMVCRQLIEYLEGLETSKPQDVVKKIQRGGFTQEFETKGTSANVPRGTLFMSDYVKYLNKFRRVRFV